MNETSTKIRWSQLLLLCLPTLSILLSTNIVMAALADINQAFPSIKGLGGWTLLLYSTTAASLSIAAGELGDRFGLRKMYGQGLIVFIIGAILSSIAISGPMLLAGRVVSGIGAAVLAPVALAFMSRLYSGDAKPIAFGYWATSVTVGTVSGPILGGWIQSLSNWRWTFPVAALPALLGLILINQLPILTQNKKNNQPVDYLGITGLSILPALTLITLTLSSRLSASILIALSVIIVGVAVFTWHHLQHTSEPAIPLFRLRAAAWWRPTLLQLIIRIIFMATLVMLTSYFQGIQELSEFNASRDLLPFCIAVGIMSFSSGYLCKSIGVKRLLNILFLTSLAGAATLFSLSVQGLRPIDWIAIVTIGLLAGGTSQLSRLALGNFPAEESMKGASLNTLVINLGLAFGAAYPSMMHGFISKEFHLVGNISNRDLLLIMRSEIALLLALFAIGAWQSFKISEAKINILPRQ